MNFFYNEENRNKLIDMLRGICILMVILLHINILVPFSKCQLGKLLSNDIYNIIFRSGYYGVMIFFVISGFLITSSIKNKWGNLSQIEITQFYRMRFARIFPCLIGLLVILSLLHIANIKGFVITTTTLKHAVLAALTFHINWLEAKTGYLPGNWDVLWSLSVEETFYLLFPIACLLCRKDSFITLIVIMFIILGPLARSYFYSDNDIWSDHSYLSCMDGIAIGSLAALHANKARMYSKFLLGAGLTLFILVFFFRHFVSWVGFSKIGINITMLEIGIACIILNANVLQFRIPTFSSLRWFGKNSYEVYLTHMFVIILFYQQFYLFKFSNKLIPIFYLLIIMVSGMIGNIVSKYFSEPLNQLIRKKGPSAGESPHVLINNLA